MPFAELKAVSSSKKEMIPRAIHLSIYKYAIYSMFYNINFNPSPINLIDANGIKNEMKVQDANRLNLPISNSLLMLSGGESPVV